MGMSRKWQSGSIRRIAEDTAPTEVEAPRYAFRGRPNSRRSDDASWGEATTYQRTHPKHETRIQPDLDVCNPDRLLFAARSEDTTLMPKGNVTPVS